MTPQEFISLYQSNPEPKPMSNQEKIKELLNGPCWESKPYLIGMDKIGVEDVMERFAEWKDKRHMEFLQRLVLKTREPAVLELLRREINKLKNQNYEQPATN